MELHEKIQVLRKKKGLTQEKLAQALYVSRTAVSKWESGRGYPNMDSLKGLSAFFGVSIDELLSGGELLTIAEEDNKKTKNRFRDLLFGLLDLSWAMLLFLPFFGQETGGGIRAVSLMDLGGISAWLGLVYWAVVIGMVLWGILMLALQNCRHDLWNGNRYKGSLLLNGAGVMVFVLSRQPYAAVFALVFLGIKVLILGKQG